jgi:hypothetical protein
MKSSFPRLKLIFLAVFGLATAAVFTYHLGWVWPADRCEARGDWWDPGTRTCAHPVLISDITGRLTNRRDAEVGVGAAPIPGLGAQAPAAKR